MKTAAASARRSYAAVQRCMRDRLWSRTRVPPPAFLATCLATSLTTCLAAPSVLAEVRARDDRGVVVALPAPPLRIVSLLPSLTESVCALGACDRLVGTDRYSNWPDSVKRLPKLGGLEDSQIERIAALHPDLVLVSASARAVDRLESLGLKVLVLRSSSRTDARRSLQDIAQLLGEPAAAELVWNRIEGETRAATARVPPALRGRRVYFEVDPTPYAAGPRSFIGETLATLGLANALPEALGDFPKLNPEYVVRLQPDIVMGGLPALAQMAGRPGWSALHALRDGQVCGFGTEQQDLLVRAGPRMGEAAGLIADCLVRLAKPPAARPAP